METVIQTLEKMGRATYREVAARLDIEPVEALNMLREQRDQGLCDFADGGWFICTATEQAKKPAAPVHQAPRLKGEEPAQVDPEFICQLLRDNGAMTTVSLAESANRNARGMVSVLRALERQGIVVKNGKGKGVTWSLPTAAEAAKPEPAPEVPTDAPADVVKPVEQIVSEIPSFTETYRAGNAVPTVRVISREIRRTKNKLIKLEKLRDAVRVIGRHKNIMQQLVSAEAENGKA